jgi:calcium-dependent protein kinase
MRNELQILEETSHPNIMRVYELLHDDKFYFIVSEFIRHGELYDMILERSKSPQGALTEKEVKTVVRQIFLALNYMHLKGIVHRDIKPENVLIENLENLEIKLTDFGFATYFDHRKGELNEVLGSPLYMPPEIVKHEKYDSKVDIWSAGVMTYILLVGKPPFMGKTKS